MTAISLLLLASSVVAAVAGYAALRAMRDLGRRLDECAHGGATVPQARAAEARTDETHRSEEIRSIVAEAMAEERERELAEARAAWAVQESGPVEEEDATLAGRGTEYEVAPVVDALLEGRVDDNVLRELRELRERDLPQPGIFVPRQRAQDLGVPAERPEVAAARRRHPSEPDFTLSGEPVASATQPVTEGREQTVERLAELAKARTPLSDVRQGPLGTLDVYLFADGTTVCLSPGHRETADALCTALREGDVPVLMGGSTVSGAYALTFSYGKGHTAYLLADRVIASR